MKIIFTIVDFYYFKSLHTVFPISSGMYLLYSSKCYMLWIMISYYLILFFIFFQAIPENVISLTFLWKTTCGFCIFLHYILWMCGSQVLFFFIVCSCVNPCHLCVFHSDANFCAQYSVLLADRYIDRERERCVLGNITFSFVQLL